MKSVVALFLILITTTIWSQLQHPKASPLSNIEQEVGLSKISVSYSRPSAKGRKIFGIRADGKPGLVPNGRIWRVGANESNKISLVLADKEDKDEFVRLNENNIDDWTLFLESNKQN